MVKVRINPKFGQTHLMHRFSRARLVDGYWIDDSVEDPLSAMFALLIQRRDRALVAEWISWLTKKDPTRAVKV